MDIEKLLDIIKEYNECEVEAIKKAYYYAERLHRSQFRQSKEPYITHPLAVAFILAEMHADRDTVCAGLLHDTLEDTTITKEDIAHDFNKDVASLVDGVTKLSKMNFSSKEDLNSANTRKIITGLTTDARIIIIKLADRLHNMRTLEYKSQFKQKENALETMEIFVPLAYYIGAYRIKSELEDLSLKYLKPDIYDKLLVKKKNIESENNVILKDMLYKIKGILEDNDIPYEVKIRTKNIYGIYKNLIQGKKISEIHDLLSLKVMVDTIENCYQTLCIVHKEYNSINKKFKDYIWNPKTNMYRSLHTTIFGPQEKLVQIQIRTFDMDKIASFGLTAYWDYEKGNARIRMQEDLKNKFQFYKSLVEINDMFSDNEEFVKSIKNELFADKIYVYDSFGRIIELPKNSTLIDYAYLNNSEQANIMIGGYVNDNYVPVYHVLNNNDRVKIVTNELTFGPKDDWVNIAQTSLAKRKIKEFNNI